MTIHRNFGYPHKMGAGGRVGGNKGGFKQKIVVFIEIHISFKKKKIKLHIYLFTLLKICRLEERESKKYFENLFLFFFEIHSIQIKNFFFLSLTLLVRR
jgi:hypothetical protein